jgi:hypothetical protein
MKGISFFPLGKRIMSAIAVVFETERSSLWLAELSLSALGGGCGIFRIFGITNSLEVHQSAERCTNVGYRTLCIGL